MTDQELRLKAFEIAKAENKGATFDELLVKAEKAYQYLSGASVLDTQSLESLDKVVEKSLEIIRKAAFSLECQARNIRVPEKRLLELQKLPCSQCESNS